MKLDGDEVYANYRPEAVLINYYGLKDTMNGHLDDGEIDQKMPIFSFNFG